MTLDEYFSTGPERERPIFEAVREHLEGVSDDDLIIEAVSVGIFFKRRQTFVELRPMQRWVALSFRLPRTVEHGRITRTIRTGPNTYHVVRLAGPEDVDDDVRGWLTDAYIASLG